MTNNKRPLSELLENLVKCGEAYYETASIRGVAELDIEVGAIKEEVERRFGELSEDVRSVAAERDRYREQLEQATSEDADVLADFKRVLRQRDDLLAALKGLVDAPDDHHRWRNIATARAAIDKVADR